MSGKIFISYRREDTRADARSVDQRLRATFGADKIFFDVDTIQKGRDFRKVLAEALDSSNVLLAIIGPNWLNGTDPTGHRRLDDPGDFVRMEIGNALKRDIAVIPVLVGGAKMPAEQDLPEDLRGLAFRQAAIITHDNFPRDVDSIERDVLALIGGKRGSSHRARWIGIAAALLAVLLATGFGLQHSGLLAGLPASGGLSAASDPTRIAADKGKAEAELKRLVEAEERLRVETKRKTDEAASQQAALETKRQADADDIRRRIDEAAKARIEAERQQQAVQVAEETRKQFDTQAAENRRKAEAAEASLKAQEAKLLVEAAEAKKVAEQDAADAATAAAAAAEKK